MYSMTSFNCLQTEATSSGLWENVKLHKLFTNQGWCHLNMMYVGDGEYCKENCTPMEEETDHMYQDEIKKNPTSLYFSGTIFGK